VSDDPAPRTTVCTVEPELADHVMQLLGDAGLAAVARSEESGAVVVTVPQSQDEHARSVIGLVLPDLLAPRQRGTRLSERLVRSAPEEDAGRGPGTAGGVGAMHGGLVDGTALFGIGPRDWTPPQDEPEDDGEFVRPEPGSIPAPRDRINRFAWAGVVLGPILLLLTALLGLNSLLTAVGIGMFVAGFATLVARHDPPPRDGWDDGAVV
jgi:hypothetical protein